MLWYPPNCPATNIVNQSCCIRALGKKALEIGRKLARSNLLQTEPEEWKLYLYNCSGEVVNFPDISMEEIYEVHCTAFGDSLAELDEAGIRHRAESWAGYSPTLKLAEVLTSYLWAYASSSKDPNIKVGGEPMYYSSHGSSTAGRLIHQPARGGRTAASLLKKVEANNSLMQSSKLTQVTKGQMVC